MLRAFVDALALLTGGGLWGALLLFAAVYARLVFTRLEADQAGRFIREVVPACYLWRGLTSEAAVGALALGSTHRALDALAVAVMCAGFLLARQALMPRINQARDVGEAGDAAGTRRFSRLHRLSVGVDALQLAVVLGVRVRFPSGRGHPVALGPM